MMSLYQIGIFLGVISTIATNTTVMMSWIGYMPQQTKWICLLMAQFIAELHR
jgi:hypothetical protein